MPKVGSSRARMRIVSLRGRSEMSQFHVSQIETRLRSLYQTDHWKDELDDVANMSRLLALFAVQLVSGPDEGSKRIVEITDGSEDRGIDAVGVDEATKQVVFVQSKWRQDGSGSMALSDVLKFLSGVRSLLGMKSDNAPAHASGGTKTAVRDLLKTPGARIRLVTATTAINPLAAEVEKPISELLEQLNDLEGIEPLATHQHLAQGELFNSIADKARPAVDIQLQMLDWGKASDPQKMFYGRVSAAEIAAWFANHGTDLFAENIRVVIPRSDINEGILGTLADDPGRFVYYNNGITILAEAIEIGPGGALNREVGYFKLSGASIVNGAQTVSTLGSALGTQHEANLGAAVVLVRCIEVPKTEAALGRSITRYANTQNEVSSQDFAFLDPEQHRLARELQVLGVEYLIRAAEVPKSKDPSKVIDVRRWRTGWCRSPRPSSYRSLGHEENRRQSSCRSGSRLRDRGHRVVRRGCGLRRQAGIGVSRERLPRQRVQEPGASRSTSPGRRPGRLTVLSSEIRPAGSRAKRFALTSVGCVASSTRRWSNRRDWECRFDRIGRLPGLRRGRAARLAALEG